MPFSAASLLLDGFEQFGDALDELVLVVLRVREELLDVSAGLRRRTIVRDALAEGDRAGIGSNQFADDRDDRLFAQIASEGCCTSALCLVSRNADIAQERCRTP